MKDASVIFKTFYSRAVKKVNSNFCSCVAQNENAIRCQIRKHVKYKPHYQRSRVKFRTVLSKLVHGQQGTI